MPNEIPRFQNTRHGELNLSSLRFRGDQFLRFTAEEARLIANAEALHGYNPQQAGRMLVSAPPPPPLPPDGGDDGDRTFSPEQLLQILGEILFAEGEGEGEDEDSDGEEEEEKEEDW
jgi:hypothetical protein